jgi:hypothetical protein
MRTTRNLFVMIAISAAACLSLTGCGLLPPPRPDPNLTISVDRAEVFTRERLISRRFTEQQWLESKLTPEHMETLEFGQSGLRDTRRFSAVLTSLGAEFSPLGGALTQDQGQLTLDQLRNQRLSNDIQRVQLEQQLAELRRQIEQGKYEAKAPAQPNAPTPLAGVTSEQLEARVKELETKLAAQIATAVAKQEIDELLKADTRKGFAPSPGDAIETRAKAHPIDELTDERAYRNAVSALLREQELDDTHDLLGRTIHTLKFDVTIGGIAREGLVAKVHCHIDDEVGKWEDYTKDDYNRLAGVLEARLREETLQVMAQLQQALNPLRSTLTQEEAVLLLAEVTEANATDIAKLAQLERQSRIDLRVLRDLAHAEGSAKSALLDQFIQQDEVGIEEVELLRQMAELQRSVEVRQAVVRRLTDSGAVSATAPTPPTTVQELSRATGRMVLKRYDALRAYFDLSETQPEPGLWLTGELVLPKVTRFPAKPEALTAKLCNLNKAMSETANLQPYVYTIEPHQLAQNISDVSALEELRSLVLSLRAAIPNTGLTAQTYNQFINQTQQRLHAILRNPLVVGYAYASDTGEASSKRNRTIFGRLFGRKGNDTHEKAAADAKGKGNSFGWVFGGSFAIDEKGKPTFRHATKTHSVQASIALPAWRNKIVLHVDRLWIDGRTGKETKPGKALQRIEIDLPADDRAVLTYLLRKQSGARSPRIIPQLADINRSTRYSLYADSEETQHLIVRGNDLWRSPRAFVGGVEAKPISILPDMRGLRLSFGRIPLPPSAREGRAAADLVIITSEGSATLAGGVELVARVERGAVAPFASLTSRYAVSGANDRTRGLSFSIDPQRVPAAYHALRVTLDYGDGQQPTVVAAGAADLPPSPETRLLRWKIEPKHPAGSGFVTVDLQVQLAPHGPWKSTLAAPARVVLFADETAAIPAFNVSPTTVTVAEDGTAGPITLELAKTPDLHLFAYPMLSRGSAPHSRRGGEVHDRPLRRRRKGERRQDQSGAEPEDRRGHCQKTQRTVRGRPRSRIRSNHVQEVKRVRVSSGSAKTRLDLPSREGNRSARLRTGQIAPAGLPFVTAAGTRS